LWNERSLGSGNSIPTDIAEQRMVLDLIGAICPQTASRVQRHQAFHEVARFRRNLDEVFVPFDVSRKDVLEHLLWGISVERRDAINKLIGDDTQGPLIYVPGQKMTIRVRECK